jgi:hypothetical protein
MVVNCQFTPVRLPEGGADGLGAGEADGAADGDGDGLGAADAGALADAAGLGDALGAGVADGAGVAAELADGAGEADADADGEAEADGATEADSDGLGAAEADAEADADAAGDAPGTPATKVIEAPSAPDSVSCPSATDHVVASVSACANSGPNESSGHMASVVIPGLIVIPSEPLVVYGPEIWLQSAVPLYVWSVLKVIE